MSGIAGIFNLDGRPVEHRDLQRMVASMARRGPDGANIWSDGPIGMGHCMLWTTPESLHENLPRTNRAGTLAITADARIDNRTELIGALALSDVRPAEISDSHLILAAYEKWGEACPARLIGDFAFAIWDSRQQTLFCARDHFGVKPFCYYRSDRVFVFASEVKALLSLPHVPRRINEARIADYLVPELEGFDKVSTFYEEIFRFPPAQRMTVTERTCQQQAYWSLDPSQEIRYPSDQEYADAFLEIFTEAVHCRLRSTGPVASMLSGGLDSSSIVGVARNLLRERGQQPLLTFSAISNDNNNCSETSFINAVLGLGQFEACTISSEQLQSFRDDLGYVLRHADDLFDNIITIPQVMYIAANKKGITSLLDGLDGDLVLSQSTTYLAYLLRSGKWNTAYMEANKYSRNYYRYFYPAWKLMYWSIRTAYVPTFLRQLRQLLEQKKRFSRITKDSIINIDFAQRIGVSDRWADINRCRNQGLFKTSKGEHTSNLQSPNITVALERYERVAAAYSIEPRHPFLDKRLVEFSLALPWKQKICNGWSKLILRQAMTGILPDQVRWRRGWDHLGWNFLDALMALEQEFFEKIIFDGFNEIKPYVNLEIVHKFYWQYKFTGNIEAGCKVRDAIVLALWLLRNNVLSVEPVKTNSKSYLGKEE